MCFNQTVICQTPFEQHKLKQHLNNTPYQTQHLVWGPPIWVFKQQTTLLKLLHQTTH